MILDAIRKGNKLSVETFINFKDDESIEATIVSESKVEYQGKQYSLTALTQELKNLDHAIQPTGEWLFDGRNLKDLYNENIS